METMKSYRVVSDYISRELLGTLRISVSGELFSVVPLSGMLAIALQGVYVDSV